MNIGIKLIVKNSERIIFKFLHKKISFAMTCTILKDEHWIRLRPILSHAEKIVELDFVN